MPEDTQSFTQRIVLELQNKIKGPDLIRHLKAVQKQLKSTDKALKSFTKAWKTQGKAAGQAAKQAVKHAKATEKQLTKTEKRIGKQVKAWAKNAKAIQKQVKGTNRLTKSQKSLQKQVKSSGGSFVNLRNVITGAGIVLIAKGIASWTKELGFAEARARALGGAFREIQNQFQNSREQKLFIQFAEQGGLSRRFSSAVELEGLKKLREELTKKLGTEFGTDLALKLTASFGKSNAELQKFLSMASVDVKTALAAFQSQDIEQFATALAAVRQETSNLTKTSLTLEQAWLDIKRAAEVFLREFVDQYGGDMNAAISGVSDSVVHLIEWIRKLAVDSQQVASYMIRAFQAVAEAAEFAAFMTGDTGPADARVRREVQIESWIQRAADERKEAEFYRAKAAEFAAQGDSPMAKRMQALIAQREKAAREASAQADKLSGKLPALTGFADTLERIARGQQDAADSAANQRKEIDKALTSAERVGLTLERLQEKSGLGNMQLDLIRSELARYESSPFGFSGAFEARMKGAGKIDELLELNRKKQAEILKLDQGIRKNKERLINAQVEENNLIAERNRLLRQTQLGYLKAIEAQAFGAGKFEKIIITQEKNLGIALAKNYVKRNPALGQSGADARASDISPFRFTTDPAANAAGLEKYAAAMKQVWKPFIDELRRTFVPPIPKQRIGAAVGAGRSRLLTGQKPKSMASSPGSDLVDLGQIIMRGFAYIAERLDERLAEHDDAVEPPPTHRPGSLANTI